MCQEHVPKEFVFILEKMDTKNIEIQTCHGPLRRMTSWPLSSNSTSADDCFDFRLYCMATSSKAPTAIGKGYHFVGVCVQAVINLPVVT